MRQCTGKMIPAHVITGTTMCIVLQAEVPTAPARSPHSQKNATRVARKCKQPCSSLHHYITSISSLNYTERMFRYGPVCCKCSFALPQPICTQIPTKLARKHLPRIPICTLFHPVHANRAPLQWCSVLVRPRRLTRTTGRFPGFPVLHWGDIRVLGTLIWSAQTLGSFSNRTVSHRR